jgi:hypothetical protein
VTEATARSTKRCAERSLAWWTLDSLTAHAAANRSFQASRGISAMTIMIEASTPARSIAPVTEPPPVTAGFRADGDAAAGDALTGGPSSNRQIAFREIAVTSGEMTLAQTMFSCLSA